MRSSSCCGVGHHDMCVQASSHVYRCRWSVVSGGGSARQTCFCVCVSCRNSKNGAAWRPRECGLLASFRFFFIFLGFGNSGRCWLNWGITSRVWCAPGQRVADFMPFCFSGLCVSAVGMSSLRLFSPSQFGSKVQPTQRTPLLLFVTVGEYGKTQNQLLAPRREAGSLGKAD